MGLATDSEPVLILLTLASLICDRWLGEDQTLLRLVTAFDTKEADVAAFIASAERHAARANEKVVSR